MFSLVGVSHERSNLNDMFALDSSGLGPFSASVAAFAIFKHLY